MASSTTVYTLACDGTDITAIEVSVVADKFTNVNGVGNVEIDVYVLKFDSRPTLTITSSAPNGTFVSSTVTFTFTTREPTTDFAVDDVTAPNCVNSIHHCLQATEVRQRSLQNVLTTALT